MEEIGIIIIIIIIINFLFSTTSSFTGIIHAAKLYHNVANLTINT